MELYGSPEARAAVVGGRSANAKIVAAILYDWGRVSSAVVVDYGELNWWLLIRRGRHSGDDGR